MLKLLSKESGSEQVYDVLKCGRFFADSHHCCTVVSTKDLCTVIHAQFHIAHSYCPAPTYPIAHQLPEANTYPAPDNNDTDVQEQFCSNIIEGVVRIVLLYGARKAENT
jgi:hypothetical protein